MDYLNKIEKFVPAAVLLGISSLLSRILGLIRDRILAHKFGASMGQGIFDIDTYYAAFRLPDFLFAVLIIGAVSTAFIPIFSRYIQKKDTENAWSFANNCLNLITIILLVLAVIAFIFAPQIVEILTPGFSPEKLALTAKITRIMLVSPVFFGLSAIAQSIENTFHKFFCYALAPIMYNISIIIFTYFWSDQYGVYAATAGVIAGALLHFLVQIPAIIKLGFRYRPIFDYKREDFKEMIRLLVPRILSISSLQIGMIVETMIASTLAAGSVAIFNYAFNLNSLPMGIIGLSTAIAAFGTFNILAGEGKHEELIASARKSLTNILFLIIPSMTGLFIMRYEIVELILGTGRFSENDIVLTANTLGFLAIGLIGQATIPLLARIFYSYKNTKTPMKITTFIVVFEIILAISFVFGVGLNIYGIAIASGIAQLTGFMVFIIALKRAKITKILEIKKVAKFIMVSAAMGILVYLIKNITGDLLLNVAVAATLGAIFYFCVSYIFKIANVRKLGS